MPALSAPPRAQAARLWQDVGLVRLDESVPSSDGFRRSWIMLFPEGDFTHPEYGRLHFSHQRLAEIKRHFDDRVRHIDIALDANHDQDKATGWLEQLQMRPATIASDGRSVPPGLWGQVRWTPLGVSYLTDQIYRYFSPEFGPWTDPETGREYQDVLIGGGLTNRPFLKSMDAVQLSEMALAEVSTRPWSAVKKSMLPRSCFLIKGDPQHKDTWKLPIYEGAGPKDDDGCYTQRGPLNLNGVRAAIAAIGGARSGQPMAGVPAGTKARLERLLARYSTTKAASELATTSGGRLGRTPTSRQDGPTLMTRANYETSSEMLDEDLLNDTAYDLAEDEDEFEDDETYTLADKKAKGKSKPVPEDDEDAADGGDDEGEELAEDDMGAMAYADGEDAMAYDEADGDGPDAEDAADEEEEAPARKRRKGSMKASESTGAMTLAEAIKLREEVRRFREENAAMHYRLYENEVAKTLDGWGKNTFQFKEGVKTKTERLRSGNIALSKVFREQYRDFMLKEAIRLPAPQRKKLNALLETALSTAVVDLTARGTSFDQEARRTRKLSDSRAGGPGMATQLEDEAQKLAAEEGKTLAEMSASETYALYERAAKRINYH